MPMSITTRLAFASAGAGLALAGTVLLVRAAWAGVALALGPVWASALIGAGLALLGALLVARARTAKRPQPTATPETAMFSAFFEGLRAGRATGARGQ